MPEDQPKLSPDKLADFERVMQLYKERLECMQEKEQTSALFAEELEKIKAKEESILAELVSHKETIRLLGMPPVVKPSPLRHYGKSGEEGGNLDDSRLAFRDFFKKNAGKRLTTAMIQKELGEHYKTGSVSGLLTYYSKRGLVENISRGVWKVSKNING